MTSIPGLNPYGGTFKKEFSFSRFQWVLPGAVARSAQPGYGAGDQPHTVKPFDVKFLQLNKITCVISANEYDMDAEGSKRLNAGGIDFVHAPVKDFSAPMPEILRLIANTIENCRTRKRNPGATLVYCGYGQGRTGTYVAAWAMIKHMAGRPEIKDMCTHAFLHTQFGVEKPEQSRAVCLAAGLTFNGGGAGGAGGGSAPSFTGPPGYTSGPSGLPMPDLPIGGTFANFGSAPSTFYVAGSGSSGSGAFKYYKSIF